MKNVVVKKSNNPNSYLIGWALDDVLANRVGLFTSADLSGQLVAELCRLQAKLSDKSQEINVIDLIPQKAIGPENISL